MNSLCHKSTETLPCRPCEPHIDTVFWQSIITMPPVQGTQSHNQTSHSEAAAADNDLFSITVDTALQIIVT